MKPRRIYLRRNIFVMENLFINLNKILRRQSEVVRKTLTFFIIACVEWFALDVRRRKIPSTRASPRPGNAARARGPIISLITERVGKNCARKKRHCERIILFYDAVSLILSGEQKMTFSLLIAQGRGEENAPRSHLNRTRYALAHTCVALAQVVKVN